MEFLDISQYIINDILRLSIATFFHTLFLLCILLLLIVLCFPFHKKKSATATATVPPIPPGKNGWPLVGESLEFLSSGWNGHPEKFFFDRMAAYSSAVFRTHLLGSKAAVFCGPTGNKFLFSNENTLVQAWWPSNVNKIFPTSIQTSNALGEVIKMRKMLPHFLKPEALHRHVGVMDATARRHFAAGWENNDTVQVFPLAKNYTFSVACRIFVSVEDPTRVARLSGPFNALASGLLGVPIDLPGTPFRRGIKASKYIRKELVAMIKQRKIELAEGRVSASQDIMSHMLVTCDEDGKLMHELDIADKILGLLVGGHDTASSACTFVVKYLAELPHVYHAVYKEQMEIASCKGPDEALSWEDIQKMKYSWNVACEVLRLAPPLQGAFREAIKDFIYCGFSIPKGWKIYWSVSSTHRNPECFPEPGKFEPSRFEGRGPAPYTYVPFGGGPRMCPGKEYARIEILVFMHHLVKRFRWEKLIPNEKVLFNPMPIPAKGLPIRLYPHILNCNHSSPTSFSLN